ncbi:MAG: hypothetical protein D6B27_07280 [Gammaproteobacteria bacterium]|nr:MAG: hypothetical protein D6B27_07280 [Gammaproteobacteria bacterium]
MKKAILGVFVVVAMLVSGVVSAGHKVNIQKLVEDTQRMEQSGGKITLVWWIPDAYWKESFRQAPGMTQAQKDEFLKMVKDYTIICVMDGKIGNFGGVKTASRTEIMKNIILSVDGRKYKPLADSQISGDAKTFLGMMKPVMSNMLGQVGSGLEFMAFDGKNKKGAPLLNPMKKGAFTVTFLNKDYKWRLPLGSLLPPMQDPKTKEVFPGNYLYNPYTGKKLIRK